MKIILVFSLLCCISCSSVQTGQGIQGHVFWVGGNQLPGPGKDSSSDRKPIAREIYIYKALTLDRAGDKQGDFYSTINGELIKTIKSQPDGSFETNLPVGQYSLFTKEDGGLFANRMDGQGCINCFDVKSREFTTVDITVDYDAAY